MATASTSWKCPSIDFYQNVLVAQAPNPPYVIPMFAPMSDLLTFAPFDLHNEQNRYVEIGADMFADGVAGRLVEASTTECHSIKTVVNTTDLALRILCMEYTECNLIVSPGYGKQESIDRVYPEVLDTSSRQMERFAYVGYSSFRNPIKDIRGLYGFKDIGAEKSGGVTTPIAPNDYSSLCKFFTEGINDVRKGTLAAGGSEFSRSDVDVHVSRDLVDLVNCSVLSNTTIGLWDQLRTSALGGVANVIISEQITNSVYFVNRRRIYGKYNSLARLGVSYRVMGNKTIYPIMLGTISFGKLNSLPVVYKENVINTA